MQELVMRHLEAKNIDISFDQLDRFVKMIRKNNPIIKAVITSRNTIKSINTGIENVPDYAKLVISCGTCVDDEDAALDLIDAALRDL